MQLVSFPDSLRGVAAPQVLPRYHLTVFARVTTDVNEMPCLLRLHDAPAALVIGPGVTRGLVAAMVARAQ